MLVSHLVHQVKSINLNHQSRFSFPFLGADVWYDSRRRFYCGVAETQRRRRLLRPFWAENGATLTSRVGRQ